MNAERLLQHYAKIAEAPDAIARLRRFVLDVAVRGKLVPQEPKDEPASELLKRVKKAKDQIASDGQFKQLDAELPTPASHPFVLPDNWVWCHLDDVAAIARGGSPRPIEAFITSDPAGIPWIKIGDSTRGSIYIDSTRERIKPDGLARSRLVKPGDLLLSNSMSFGYPYITNVEGCIHDGWLVIRVPEDLIDKLYLHKVFLSTHAKSVFSEAAAGAVVQNLNADKARRLTLPLPPTTEQRRIVAKVDELMALCDQLEAARAEREKKRDRVTASSLARMNSPNEETYQSDARFTLSNLPALTARPDQIKQFRQTILNLAVRGKLVPQDPKDEPASELLKRIRMWQRRAIEQKTIRAPRKPLLPTKADDYPYTKPDGWSFARLGELIYIQSGDGLTAANMTNGPVPVFGGNGINGYHDQNNVNQPTIVIGRVGYYCGSIHVTPPGAWVTDNAFITHFSQNEIDLRFLVLLLTGTNLKEDENATAQPVISGSKIYPIVVGLPPLAEQKRIVAKVDELLALCDKLEASLNSTDVSRANLLDALLAEALGGAATLEAAA